MKRELFENYLLSVVATDRGEPPLSASMTIVIQVIKVDMETKLVVGDTITSFPGFVIFTLINHMVILQVQQVVTVAPGTGIGFDKDELTVFTLSQVGNFTDADILARKER